MKSPFFFVYFNMLLYTIGCSHTFGHCVGGPKNSWPNLFMEKLYNNNFNSHYSNTQQFNIDDIRNSENFVINESNCGAGNDYIFHTFIESYNKLKNENLKPDLVIIQWSGPNRRIHQEPNGQLIFVNPQENYDYHVKYEPMGSLHTLQYMFLIQEMLKRDNVKYYFFNYMSLSHDIFQSYIYNSIDNSKFIKFTNNSSLIDGLMDFIKNEKLTCDDLGHPNSDGYNFIVKKLIQQYEQDN